MSASGFSSDGPVPFDEESSLLMHPVQPDVGTTRSFSKIIFALTAAAAVTLVTIGTLRGAFSKPRNAPDTTSLFMWSPSNLYGSLCRGQDFQIYETLKAPNYKYTLWNQNSYWYDGGIAMKDSGNKVIWSAGPSNSFRFQEDGNIVFYDGNTVKWATGTSGTNAAIVVAQNDGDLVLYGADGRRLWHSNSAKIQYNGPTVEFLLTNCPGPLFVAQGSWTDKDLGQVGSTSGGLIISFGSGGWQDAGFKAYPNCMGGQSAISGFKLVNKPGYVGYFSFQCTAASNYALTPYLGDTPGSGSPQDVGGMEFLDRQHFKAGPGAFLSQWYFTSDGNQLKANWNAVKFGNVKSFVYIDFYTSWANKYDGLIFLDRLNVQCPPGSALNLWEGMTTNTNTKTITATDNVIDKSTPPKPNGNYQNNGLLIHYVCASAWGTKALTSPTTAPTSAPFTSPTAVPISLPTVAPSAVPISSPTEVPISEPTESPISIPTFAPSPVPISVLPISNPSCGVRDSCPFIYTKGLSSSVPPPGCVLLADKDLGAMKVGKKSNAAYICGSSAKLVQADLKSCELIGSITTIAVGVDTTVNYYSADNFGGIARTAYPLSKPSLVGIFFQNPSLPAADNVQSLKFNSNRKAELPSDCSQRRTENMVFDE